MNTASCNACGVDFSIAKHGLICPVCKAAVAGAAQIIRDKFCDYEDEPPAVLLGLSPAAGSTFMLADLEHDMRGLAEDLGKNFKVSRGSGRDLPAGNLLCGRCAARVVSDGKVLTCGAKHCVEPFQLPPLAAELLAKLGNHGNGTYSAPTARDIAALMTKQLFRPWVCNPPTAARCPLPVRWGFTTESSDQKPRGFLSRLTGFAEKSREAIDCPGLPDPAGNTPSVSEAALLALLPNYSTENMFFAALMPWLRGRVAWNIHNSVPFSRTSPLWLVMRILPTAVPVLGTKCPPDLAPADFEVCTAPGLEFLRIYFGRDEARHWHTAARIARKYYDEDSSEPLPAYK